MSVRTVFGETDYNKKLAELKKALESDQWDKEMDLLDFASENGAGGLTRYLTTLKKSVLEDYFTGKDKSEILDILQNDTKIKSMIDEDTLNTLIRSYSK